MKLHFDFVKKEVTVKGDFNKEELESAVEGKEDWNIVTESGVTLTIKKKRKFAELFKAIP